jgi:hypothetical protein
VGNRQDSVKKPSSRLDKSGVITSPPGWKSPRRRPVAVYVFSGQEGKRDTYVVVCAAKPEFTGLLVDRWQSWKTLQKSRHFAYLKEALIHLVAQVEEERLTEQNEALDEALSIARPKAILMDRLAGTSEQYGINEAGRILGTSAVMASCMDMVAMSLLKKILHHPAPVWKQFIDREYGRNVTSTGGGHIQANLRLRGFAMSHLETRDHHRRHHLSMRDSVKRHAEKSSLIKHGLAPLESVHN